MKDDRAAGPTIDISHVLYYNVIIIKSYSFVIRTFSMFIYHNINKIINVLCTSCMYCVLNAPRQYIISTDANRCRLVVHHVILEQDISLRNSMKRVKYLLFVVKINCKFTAFPVRNEDIYKIHNI